jgi:WS/DGAT/MGAT family acyltransferase
MRQLSALDAQFLALDDGRSVGHVGGLAIYDPSTIPGGQFTLQRLLDHFQERLPLLRPLRERLIEVPFGIDHPYWVEDPDFDLEYHVREIGLPAPGDDRQLAEQVARIHARPLDRSRPLWESYLISGLAGDRVAIFSKIHHAAVDGLSGAEVLVALADFTPEGRAAPPPVRPAQSAVPGQWEMLGRGLAGLPRQSLRTLAAVPRTLRHLDQNPALRTVPGVRQLGAVVQLVPGLRRGDQDGDMLDEPRARAPRTRFNGPVSAHRRTAFTSLSLPKVKDVKNHFRVTVNDVVVAVCATAVRSWLEKHGELPDAPLVAMVPLSVRTAEQLGTFGNRVSLMMVPIPTDVAEPAGRLARAHAVLASAKNVHRAIPASVLQDSTQFVPPVIVSRASRATLAALSRAPIEPPCNLVISNVPGSPVPLYLGGALMLANYPISAVTHGLGLNITVLSYRNALDVGVVVDREQMSDPWALIEGMQAAVEELHALTSP